MPSRIIRDGINSSPRINALTPGAEIFYRRLLSVVDDYGRFHSSPATLRGACWPTNPERVTDEQVIGWVIECAHVAMKVGALVNLYEAHGARYLEVVDFKQKIRSKSKFPGIADGLPTTCDQYVDSLRTICGQTVDNPPALDVLRISNFELRTSTGEDSAEAEVKLIEMPSVSHSEFPKTAAAIAKRYPTADAAIIAAIINATVQAYISVDNPKIREPSDADIASAIEIASKQTPKQNSPALYLKTVPAVIGNWAKHGRVDPGKPKYFDIREITG